MAAGASLNPMGSENRGPASLEASQLVTALDDLIEMWERWTSAGTINLRSRRGFEKSERQAVVLVTLTQHLVQLMKVVRPSLPDDLPITLVPVAREALETGVWIVWMDRFRDAADAAINEDERNRVNLTRAMLKSDLVPDGVTLDLPEWTRLSTATASHARSFQQMTEALGIPEIYVYYRIMSEHSHPGVRIVDQYVEQREDGTPMFRGTAKPGFESVLATRVLPVFLLKAIRIVTYMTRDVEQRREVREVARALQVDVDRLFGSAS